MTDSTIKHIATILTVDPEALKPKPKFHRRRSIVREFSLNTSTHGLPGIARSESIHNRLFWTISSLAFASIMIYFITLSIKAYFGYPTQTSVNIIVERLQPFPAVSICNYSPIRFDTFIGPFINYTNFRTLTNTNDTNTITHYQADFIRDFIREVFLYNGSVTQYFFPLESMLIACAFNGQQCNSSDFLPFLSADHGLCYTFNAKIKFQDNSVRLTTDHGGSGKLQLKLYVHSHQYVPYVSDDVSAGMMAMVHDNTELPLIGYAGIQLAPGRKHRLSYKKRIYHLLSSPYSDCTSKIPSLMQAMFDQYQGADYAYTPVICYLLCIQTYVYQECNCVDPYQWTARSVIIPATHQIISASLCNISDSCYENATNRIRNTDSIWNQFCFYCSPSCSSVDFTVTPSSVAAPSIEQTYSTRSFVETSGIPLPNNWNETWFSEIQNNYVAVDIITETTRMEVYTEDPSISPVDLISNIGGHTGLWIGVSFLSIMELVEMLYRLIRYHCYVRKRQREDEATIREQF